MSDNSEQPTSPQRPARPWRARRRGLASACVRASIYGGVFVLAASALLSALGLVSTGGRDGPRVQRVVRNAPALEPRTENPARPAVAAVYRLSAPGVVVVEALGRAST